MMDAGKARLLLIALTLLSSGAWGQEKKTIDLDQRIYLANSLRLDSLLKKITRPTGLIFSYNTRKVNHGLQFSFAPKNYSVEEILIKIKEKTGLDYTLADNYIILKSARLLASPQKLPMAALRVNAKAQGLKDQNSKPNLSLDSSKNGIETAEGEKKASDNTISAVPEVKTVQPVKEEEKKIEPQLTDVNSSPIKPQIIKKDSAVKKPKPLPGKPALQLKAKKSSPVFLRAGISVDETIYAGPTIQLGHPKFYGIVSYKTDFKLKMVSYGVGSSFKLGNNLNLCLQVNTGSVSQFYDSARLSAYDSASIHRGINAKSNLTRIGFLIEKRISTHFIFQGGLQYNLLTTRFSTIPLSDDGKRLCAISPPYLLSNTNSRSGDSNVKSWIGIQLSLLYTINFSKKK